MVRKKKLIKITLLIVSLMMFYRVIPKNSLLEAPHVIGKENPVQALEQQKFNSSEEGEKREKIVGFSQKLLGVPYKYAEESPKKGFDCSGFVYYVFKHFDIVVPRSSSAFEKFGKEVSISEAQKGDIIVFTGTDAKNRKAGHVGIVIVNSENKLMFIHSSSSKRRNGVVINELSEGSSYKKRFLSIRKVID